MLLIRLIIDCLLYGPFAQRLVPVILRFQRSEGRSVHTITGSEEPLAVDFIETVLTYETDEQFRMGLQYAHEVDLEKAAFCFWVAAEAGHLSSKSNIAMMLHNGIGIQKDCQEAFSWFEAAAMQNHALSQYCLGRMYERGDGVTRSSHKAYYWYRKASAIGGRFRTNPYLA